MAERTYDPRTAFLGMRTGLKQLTAKAKRADAPRGLVNLSGDITTPAISTGPATCCVLLLAFAKDAPMVPDDFKNVPRTKDGIANYVRPDGGVYLGAFELPHDPGGVVLVWGDPAMSQEQAVKASLAYRRKLHETMELHSGLRTSAPSPRLVPES